LVIDGQYRILVDTGLATDINGRTWMLQRLNDLGFPPPSIDFVITTHGHPDHSGNTNDFPDARHYAGTFMHHRMHFDLTNIFEDDVQKLTENVYLLKTPGHTSEDIAVLVKNTTFFGTVVISGKLFMMGRGKGKE
uniref:Metallo-beta-lactamase domain-containing protein 1 n=1 Tax=Gongylonema pulchrum TaxID=637853 RepID=A0A183EYT3_9BILA